MSLFLLRKSHKTDSMSEMPNSSQKKADLLMSLFVATRFSRTGVKRYAGQSIWWLTPYIFKTRVGTLNLHPVHLCGCEWPDIAAKISSFGPRIYQSAAKQL